VISKIVDATLRKFHDIGININGSYVNSQLRSCGADGIREGINLRTLAATENSQIDGCASDTIQQSDQQFNFRAIAKKERAGVLPSRRPQLNQPVQMSAIQRAKMRGYARKSRKLEDDSKSRC
jgi:hypothetical protein